VTKTLPATIACMLAAVLAGCCSSDERAAPPPPPSTAAWPSGGAVDPAIPGGVAPSVPAATPAPAPPRAEDVTAVVEYLLARIAGSGLTFIRNGSEHTAAEAAAHIRDKYEHFKREIKTPEDFIDKAATKSMLSGKPYLVKLPDGTTRPAADWLRDLLAEYRAKPPEAA